MAVLLAVGLGAVGGCIVLGDFAPLASGPSLDASADAPNEGSALVCSPGERRSCYAGPPAAAGVGACARGSQACLPDRSGYGACEGSALPRAEKCDTKDVDESCDGEPACTGAPRLQLALGDGLDQHGAAIAVDDAGDVFVAGVFAGTLDTHGGPTVQAGGTGEVDGFVVKMSPDGRVKWATRVVDAKLRALAVSKGKLAVVGASRAPSAIEGCAPLPHAGADGFDDVLVATLDPDTGRCVAARAFGAAFTDVATAVAIDPTNGDVFVGGTIAGGSTVDFGGGLPPLVASPGRDGFGLRMDEALRPKALDHLKGGVVDVNAVTVDRLGRAYIGGGWNGSLQVNGPTQTYTSSGQSGFVVSLPQSVQVFSGNRIAEVSALRTDASDRLVVGGFFTGELYGTSGAQPDFTSRGSEDGFVAWFFAGGAGALGIVQVGGAGHDRVTALAVDALSQVVILGTTTGGVDLGGGPLGPGAGVFAGKLRFKEPLVWGRAFPGQAAVGGVATDPLTGVWITGAFAKEMDFGGAAPLKAATLDPIATDVFVVQRAP